MAEQKIKEQTPQATPEPSQEPPSDGSVDYVAVITEMDSKLKDAENRLKASQEKEKQWMDKALNNTREPEPVPAEVVVDVKELRESVLNGSSEMCNLDFAKKTLALREELMKKEGYDPFVPYSSKDYQPGIDEAKAQRVADALQTAIDASGDDPAVFQTKFSSLIADDLVFQKPIQRKR